MPGGHLYEATAQGLTAHLNFVIYGGSEIPHKAVAKEAKEQVKRLSHRPRGGFGALTIGALGIVYGDIGTSPLYAMDQLFLCSGPDCFSATG